MENIDLDNTEIFSKVRIYEASENTLCCYSNIPVIPGDYIGSKLYGIRGRVVSVMSEEVLPHYKRFGKHWFQIIFLPL